jgi:hypothetical protein
MIFSASAALRDREPILVLAGSAGRTVQIAAARRIRGRTATNRQCHACNGGDDVLPFVSGGIGLAGWS